MTSSPNTSRDHDLLHHDSNKHRKITDSQHRNIDSGNGPAPQLTNGSSPHYNGPAPHTFGPAPIFISSCSTPPVRGSSDSKGPHSFIDPPDYNLHSEPGEPDSHPGPNPVPQTSQYKQTPPTAHDVITSASDLIGSGPGVNFTEVCSTLHPNINPALLERHSRRVSNFWPSITQQAAAEFPDFARCYNEIKAKNCPNFIGARVTLNSALNLDRWEQELHDYHDKEICQFLRYGWPIGYESDSPPTSVEENHYSGQQHLPHVRKFIQKELHHSAIVGPFSSPPFHPWTRISPILTRPKKETDDRRIIIDLSFPKGQAVNNGIDINSIFGRDYSYILPSISDLTSAVLQHGPGAWIWKADLSRAYRQLRVDPLDCPLLGMQVDGRYYIDLCPSFGCRSSSAACQRTSNALTFIMAKAGCHLLAYLDDYASCAATEEKATHDYHTFIETAQNLGLSLAKDKCHHPSRSIEWLGFLVDTQALSVSVPHKKLVETLEECKKWIERSRINKRNLQSLVGKLVHVSSCITHGRRFTGRLLGLLRGMDGRNWTTLSPEAKLDINWFLQYAAHGNGRTLINPETEYFYIECDACLHGGGGISSTHFYKWTFTQELRSQFNNIHSLEALNLLVAYKTLAPESHPARLTVILLTDNMASSFALSSGRTKDTNLGACARQLWLEAARRDQHFVIQHKPGSKIPLADALSRFSVDPSKAAYAINETSSRGLTELAPVLNGYSFFSADL